MAATSHSELPQASRTALVRRYAAIGDSFTAGVPGDPDGAGRWPDELAGRLRERHPEVDYRNLAVAGATSGEVAGRQVDRAVAFEPDVATVLCGANDVLLSVRPDIDAYRRTFADMLARLSAAAPDAYLLTATCADFSPWVPLGPRSRRRVADGLGALNEATRETAERHGAVCLDFAGHSGAAERENYAADGLHPSRRGNRRTAIAFADALLVLEDGRAPQARPTERP